jgi:2,3-dihydroxybenzoate decarboxylase
MLGYGAEAALHAMRLVCSGLFDQYPNLKIILGHGGEGIPFWLWRMDKGGMRPMSAGGSAPAATNGMRCKKTPSTYIKENFFVNTSGMPWPPVLQFLHSALGADKILFAVDYPAESNTLEVQAIEALKISSSDKEKIFHGNAEKLLGV